MHVLEARRIKNAGQVHYPVKYIPFPPFVESYSYKYRTWILFFIPHVILSRLPVFEYRLTIHKNYIFLKEKFFQDRHLLLQNSNFLKKVKFAHIKIIIQPI